jgi:phosphoglycerate dehydrogenase-like enzyme
MRIAVCPCQTVPPRNLVDTRAASPTATRASKCPAWRVGRFSLVERQHCLRQTDVLVLCTRLREETRGLVDADFINALPRGSLLVNAARGSLIDYGALFDALRNGHLAGAGLDVYWNEPICPKDPLLTLPNVIATPHVAGVTDRSYGEIADAVACNIVRLSRRECLLHCVV